jgi:hypothetical protein
MPQAVRLMLSAAEAEWFRIEQEQCGRDCRSREDAMEGTAALSKAAKDEKAWRDLKPGPWRNSSTKAVWAKLQPYFKEEQKKGVLAVDAKTPSTLLAHKAGYIDRDNE